MQTNRFFPGNDKYYNFLQQHKKLIALKIAEVPPVGGQPWKPFSNLFQVTRQRECLCKKSPFFWFVFFGRTKKMNNKGQGNKTNLEDNARQTLTSLIQTSVQYEKSFE